MELTEEEQREGERWLEEQNLGGDDKDSDLNAIQLQNLNLKDDTNSNVHVLNEEEEEAYDQFLKQMGGPGDVEVEGGMNDEEAEAYEQFLEAQERAKLARGPCRFFLQGKCLKGENCSFSHSPQAHSDDGRGSSRGGRGGGYYHNNYYNHNYNYNYNYNQGYRDYEGTFPPQQPSSYYAPSDQGASNTKEVQCKFFASGNCRYGNGCRFKH
eukprot:TRINITY_DN290_c0_g1_i1.p1 TRINITY_DN290_c0_g1~~TRINITY_DN290_c0_g1_i1.p1  ORF type:complete len:228 (-),score=53.56 TRINITY_DN290_c0_g1_i1:219-851(-)